MWLSMLRNGRQGKSHSRQDITAKRATLIFVSFLLCYAALLGRMAFIQIAQHKYYLDRAKAKDRP